MAGGSCPGSKMEQLYMLELLVDRLILSPEKAEDVGNSPLCVRIRFIDFPAFEVSQEEFASAKKRRDKEAAASPEPKKSKDASLDFGAGKSCLFGKEPRELVHAMQSRPLKVGVYKVAAEPVCGMASDYVPICESQIPLSGCLCDQVAMAMNDADHLPKPFVLKSTFSLTDLNGKPSGTIAISMRLSCFGKSIVTHFAFQEKSFLFKSSQHGNEFQCTRVSPGEEDLPKKRKDAKGKVPVTEAPREPELGPLPQPRDVVGLAPICHELTRRDCCPANVRPSLTAPKPAPRVGIDDPGFDKLTNAEKLNDREYRGLVYRAYPNEPTCRCTTGGNSKETTGDAACRGKGCAGSCCMGSISFNIPPKSDPTRCENDDLADARMRGGGLRMRGGGLRMRGGGCCGGGGGTPGRPVSPTRSNGPSFGAYNPLQSRSPNSTPGCCCLGRNEEATVLPGVACTKKPCLGIDCLIRAFQETQDFVDSLGRVPGLAGLGLMDPSESPYFGRDNDYPDIGGAPRKQPLLPPQLPNASNPQYGGPCNVSQTSRPTIAGTTTSYAISAAGRSGVVREAIPTLPEVGSIVYAKTKKKDEKGDKQKELEPNPSPPPEIEMGPCGEPKCKSRRRMLLDENSPSEGTGGNRKESALKKPASPSRPTSGGSSKPGSGGRSYERSKGQSRGKFGGAGPGPGGDRNTANKASNVKPSRRIMKFVYTAGTKYPGVNYGHKNCVDSRLRVPANMGWLWNINTTVGKLKPRLGWRPGAISRFVNELLKEAKLGSGESRPMSAPSKGKKGKVMKSKSFVSMKKSHGAKKKEGEDEEVELPPTLHIHRKDGTYYVTMYPIKQETMDVPQLEEPMKPLQFKITKNKDDVSVASSSTASDMEIEFSPPAAVNRYRRKPNVIHVDTQVKQQEILNAFKPPGSEKKEKRSKKGKK